MKIVALSMPGAGELVVIGLVLVLLFGARKLPELARSLGSSLTQFKKGMREDAELPPPKDPSDSEKKKLS